MAGKDHEEFEAAVKRALKFLGYSARTEKQVKIKLTQLGFSTNTIEATLERLRSLNLLNDETFARDWALTRAANHGYGLKRIERDLRLKGIAESLIGTILQETFANQDERERARALLEKKFKDQDLSDLKVLRRASDYLHRRGYSESIILELIKGNMDSA